jgi:hypothetical protein
MTTSQPGTTPSFIVHKNTRREVRRSVRLLCRVVRERDFKLLATRALDVSPGGMLVMSVRDAEPGETLILSFRATDLDIWFDAEGVVARVIRGRRTRDRGRCLGIRFTKLDAVSRVVLRSYLRRTAPPVPARPPSDARIDYAATIKRIAVGA